MFDQVIGEYTILQSGTLMWYKNGFGRKRKQVWHFSPWGMVETVQNHENNSKNSASFNVIPTNVWNKLSKGLTIVSLIKDHYATGLAKKIKLFIFLK